MALNSDQVNDLLTQLNCGDLTTFAQKARLLLLAKGASRTIRKQAPLAAAVNPYVLATLGAITLPDGAKAHSIRRATVRAGGVTGELTPVAYGATPITTQIAVSPNGDIVVLGTDAITDMDVVYDVEPQFTVELVLAVAAGVLTIPTTFQPSGYAGPVSNLGVVSLLEAEALAQTAGTVKKIVLVPGAAPATGQARLNVAKTQVLFNTATDIVTSARVKLGIVQDTI